MKLSKDFLFHTVGEESVLVPSGSAAFSGMVRGNKTFGAVLALLQSETTEEALVANMRKRFSAPDGVIERDVSETLKKLREIGALEE
jgi:hypothetical protein